MKIGRELDKLVGEKVFGYEVVTHNSIGRPDYFYKKDGALIALPQYSTHIASAWLVAKRGTEDYGLLNLQVARDNTVAYFSRAGTNGPAEIGVTAAHAICLAALATVIKQP
jgi:hypothetical protein